jgi:hypothetical protein
MAEAVLVDQRPSRMAVRVAQVAAIPARLGPRRPRLIPALEAAAAAAVRPLAAAGVLALMAWLICGSFPKCVDP